MADKTTMANKTFRAIKSFRVRVFNRDVRVEKGLKCELIEEALTDYLMKLDNNLEWWVPKDKLSTYFEEVSLESKQP